MNTTKPAPAAAPAHSQLPRLRVCPESNCWFESLDKLAIGKCNDAEHTAAIVTACNSHARLTATNAALVAALETIATGMGNLPIEQIGDAGVNGVNDGKQRAIYLQSYVQVARAALALARAEE